MRKIHKKTPVYSTFRHVNHFRERQHSQNGYSNLVKQKAALYCKEKQTWRNSVTYIDSSASRLLQRCLGLYR